MTSLNVHNCKTITIYENYFNDDRISKVYNVIYYNCVELPLPF